MTSFADFGLSKGLMDSLDNIGFKTPTPIQIQAIPIALQGQDILGSAQTGTGKTGAFSIPLVEGVMNSFEGSALVLTPTRELAKQVLDAIKDLLGPRSGIRTAFIIGGEPMGKQLTQLRSGARIIVGTPGRINDHLERGTLQLSDTRFLVLDETDRMLDMGFDVQLEKIIKQLPKERQTLMFSATLPKSIIQMAGKYMKSPKRISVGETNVIATNIKQEVIRIEQDKKYTELLIQLHEREGSIIVFAKTKHSADKMSINLRRDGFTSEALHGDLRQNKRDRVMNNFRKQNFRILVATDIAARGLDVSHIEHVINYDLPQVAEDYIHRMGRTARAGATGSAISFVSSQDWRKWRAIEDMLNPGAKRQSDNDNYGDNKKRRPKKFGDKSAKWGKDRPSYSGSGAPRGEKSQDSNNRPKARTDRSEKFAAQRQEQGQGQDQRQAPRQDRNSSYAGKPSQGKSYGQKRDFDETRRGEPAKKRFVAKPGIENNSHAKPKTDDRKFNSGDSNEGRSFKKRPASEERGYNGNKSADAKSRPFKSAKPAGKYTPKGETVDGSDTLKRKRSFDRPEGQARQGERKTSEYRGAAKSGAKPGAGYKGNKASGNSSSGHKPRSYNKSAA